jgi:hypothetical protein
VEGGVRGLPSPGDRLLVQGCLRSRRDVLGLFGGDEKRAKEAWRAAGESAGHASAGEELASCVKGYSLFHTLVQLTHHHSLFPRIP